MFAAACSASPEATREPQAPAPPASAARPPSAALVDPCADSAIRFEVTPPAAGDPTATFAFRWKGEGYGSSAKTICLVRGAEVEHVPRGEHREVAIRADTRALQRIVVGKRQHLIAVPPGADITLGDNPCFFYELSGPSTDPWFAPKPIAYCAQRGRACRAGYFHPAPPRPVEDDLCGKTDVIRRCVAEAEIRLTGTPAPAPTTPDDDVIDIAELAGGAPLRLAPRTCGFSTLDTGREQVALVVGAGERWSLTIDASGSLSGELIPRSPATTD
jgi:hypothetical protein